MVANTAVHDKFKYRPGFGVIFQGHHEEVPGSRPQLTRHFSSFSPALDLAQLIEPQSNAASTPR